MSSASGARPAGRQIAEAIIFADVEFVGVAWGVTAFVGVLQFDQLGGAIARASLCMPRSIAVAPVSQ